MCLPFEGFSGALFGHPGSLSGAAWMPLWAVLSHAGGIRVSLRPSWGLWPRCSAGNRRRRSPELQVPSPCTRLAPERTRSADAESPAG